MRSLLITFMLLPPLYLIVAMLVLYVPLKRFQRSTPQIRTAADLQRLKSLATAQMYASMFVNELMLIPFAVWVYGRFVAGDLVSADLLLYGVIPFLGVVAAAFLLEGRAQQVQAIEATDPSLQAQRDHIIDVWLHRRLPKF